MDRLLINQQKELRTPTKAKKKGFLPFDAVATAFPVQEEEKDH